MVKGNPAFTPIRTTTRDNRRKKVVKQVPQEDTTTYSKAHVRKIPTSTNQKRKK